MDTNTVFEIIEKLDARIFNYELNKRDSDDIMVLSDLGAITALEDFRDYLQKGFIEAKVSQAEDQMNEVGY